MCDVFENTYSRDDEGRTVSTVIVLDTANTTIVLTSVDYYDRHYRRRVV